MDKTAKKALLSKTLRSRRKLIREKPPLSTVAEAEAKKMRAVNPAQYYRQNLGQLGFGDPEHALVQTIKELVDNSLDAAEAMGVLPEITVEVTATEKEYEVVINRSKEGGIRKFPIFKVSAEDNGCGVVRNKVAKAFGKVLYGSKFFSFKQSRGQQGLGVHAAIIYAQLTSLEPAVITTKTEKDDMGYRVVLKIDTERNVPVVISSETVPFPKPHGTKVELMVAGEYTKKVESFIKQLTLSNPHADLRFILKPSRCGEEQVIHYPRATEILPPQPREIKPHILSMEPGALLEMISNDRCCATAKQFLVRHFVRISDTKALQILHVAKIPPNLPPKSINIESLFKAAKEVDIMRPPLDVLSPIGEEALKQSLKRLYPDAEFIEATSRDPWSYRGIPFQVEVGVAYGGTSVINDCDVLRPGIFKAKVIRLGNKCPLIYDSKDCLLYKTVKEINWRNYKLPQEEGSLPLAPMVLVVSLISTKVPYTAPGKFAVAYHDEIHEQLRLALQSLGRMIHSYISHRQRQEHERHRQSIFQIYAKEIAKDLSLLTERREDEIFNKLMSTVKPRWREVGLYKIQEMEKPKVEEVPTPKPVTKKEDPQRKKLEKSQKPQHTLDAFIGW